MQRLSRLKEEAELWEGVSSRIKDALELAELEDESLEAELTTEVDSLAEVVHKLNFEAMMSGKYDQEDAILSIHAGAGGTESQDWASMLLRMFLRWAESHKMDVEIIDQTDGEEAGIKSATLTMKGAHAYGYLQSERGVHRLVRISPFDANKRRHTSFALVEVVPDVQGDINIEINESDLEIDYYRSSGAGGQHVQKNETAVRIVHKQEEEFAQLKGDHVAVNFGSQIRSYVLHPYQMVKDHRTDYESGNTGAVLDGRLDEFMEAYLRAKVGQS